MHRSLNKKRPTHLPADLIWEVPQTDIYEFFPKKTKYCLIVFSWNEGERIKSQLQKMKSRAHLADIIIADGNSVDGSTDSKFLKDNSVRTLLVTDEKGLGTATRMAIAYALEQQYQGIITVDGNGKDSVEDISKFIELLNQDYDFVQGSRFIKEGVHKNTPIERYLGIKLILNPIISIGSRYKYTDITNDFKAYKSTFILNKKVQPLRNIFTRFSLQYYLNYQAARLRIKLKEIPVKRVYPNQTTIPTKIEKVRTKLLIIWEAFMTAIGYYNPPLRKPTITKKQHP